jgi:hypothetical protein
MDLQIGQGIAILGLIVIALLVIFHDLKAYAECAKAAGKV